MIHMHHIWEAKPSGEVQNAEQISARQGKRELDCHTQEDIETTHLLQKLKICLLNLNNLCNRKDIYAVPHFRY